MTGLDVPPTVVITHTTLAMLKQIKVKDQQIILNIVKVKVKVRL